MGLLCSSEGPSTTTSGDRTRSHDSNVADVDLSQLESGQMNLRELLYDEAIMLTPGEKIFVEFPLVGMKEITVAAVQIWRDVGHGVSCSFAFREFRMSLNIKPDQSTGIYVKCP